MLLSDLKKKLLKMTQENISAEQQTVKRAPRDYKDLELIIPGKPVTAGSGEFYMVRRKLDELLSGSDMLIQRYCNLFASNPKSRANFHKLEREFRKFLSLSPANIIFLDIETTGLYNTPLFLIGLAYFNGESFVVDQLFARDYSEEANLLHYFSEFAPEFNMLITFNGKSFDARFIKDRMIYHRKRFEWTQTHVDILHHSRRQWRRRVPDCKLQTLEHYICERPLRVDDIPGELVPEVYRDFIQTGNVELLADVFHHNALDLITLVDLAVTLAELQVDFLSLS